MIRFESVSYTYPFQNTPAVQDISFTVRPGELVLCTGMSGCGKTTLMRLANGLCPQYYRGTLTGDVTIGGMSTTSRPLHELADDVGTLFQNPEEQFFALNVEEELVFAHEWRGRSADEIRARLEHVSGEFGLESMLTASVNELSEGQKQKVGLAAILSQRPRVLILDEPTANLDPESTVELAQQLGRLKKAGIAVLVVDHRLYWLPDVADRVLVMDKGRIAEQGEFALLSDDALRERYGLRRHMVDDPRLSLPDAASCGGAPRLEMENFSFAYPDKPFLFSGSACSVFGGVTAIIGDNGVGKTTLARLLTGLNKAGEGNIRLDGQAITPDALLGRSSLVLQNADHQLYMRTALEEVATCLRFATGQSHTGMFAEETRENGLDMLAMFDLLPLADRHPQSLSGGEKQRLVIACAFAKRPDVLILDEPTSGLDGRNMHRIASALADVAGKGTCVLVITHDLELMAIACTAALRLPVRQTAAADNGDCRPAV
jgi:ATPase components of various ABC-type transport systems, contain duplicated ATPase